MQYQNLIEIGKRAKERRKSLPEKLTQRQAADKIQAHRNDISEIEQGKYTGNLMTFIRYLNLVGLTLTTKTSANPTLDELDAIFNAEDD